MSDVVALASARRNQLSLLTSTDEADACADEIATASDEACSTTRFNVISAALSARRSIAISALALAKEAQASVLHLLR